MKLETAVVQAIEAKKAEGESFTAHDITNSIRNSSNAGDIRVNGCNEVDVAGQKLQEIEHGEVREFVTELYETKTLGLDRTRDGRSGAAWLYYADPEDLRNYESVKVEPVTDDSDDADAASGSAVTIPVADGDDDDDPVVVQVAQANNSNVRGLISSYLTNQKEDGRVPTLKNIQSRLKGIPASLPDIQDHVLALGHGVEAVADGRLIDATVDIVG